MEALAYPSIVPVADYLSGEEAGEVRHEYLGGEVHAMAGNLCLALRTHLRGRPCRAFMENVKVNLTLSLETINEAIESVA